MTRIIESGMKAPCAAPHQRIGAARPVEAPAPARRAAVPGGGGSRRCPKCGSGAIVVEPASLACFLCGWRGVMALASERAWFAVRRESLSRRAAVGYRPDRSDQRRLWRQYRLDVQCASISNREEFQSSAAAGRLRAMVETEFEPTAWFRREVM